MAQLYSTGPVDVWVGVGSQGTPAFLGHGERGPQIQFRPEYEPVHNDLGGRAAFDAMYAGELATVSVDLTRWNEAVYRLIANKSAPTVAAASVRGTDPPGSVGTLMVTEGQAYKLWLRFPRSTLAAYSNVVNGAQPAGYRFFAAVLNDDSLPALGTQPRKIHLLWTCYRAFDPTVFGTAGYGGLSLYDHDVSALGAID